MKNKPDQKLDLTSQENEIIKKSFDNIRNVLNKRNINIKNVIGLVTTDEVKQTSKQIDIRFGEEVVAHMNMIAFN